MGQNRVRRYEQDIKSWKPLLHAYPRIRPTIEVSKPPAVTPHSWKGLPMGNATTFVGPDVHARSVKACAFIPETGETIRKSFGYEPGEVASWASSLPQPAKCVESESAPDPLTSGFPFRHDGRKREGGHDGSAISQVHGRARRRGLENGTDRAKPARGSVHHSDHGSQYVSLLPSKTMRENGVRPSMGSISSPWDNAAMESLMGIVRTLLPAVVTPPSERKSAAGA